MLDKIEYIYIFFSMMFTNKENLDKMYTKTNIPRGIIMAIIFTTECILWNGFYVQRFFVIDHEDQRTCLFIS